MPWSLDTDVKLKHWYEAQWLLLDWLPNSSTGRMRDALVLGGDVEPRAATNGGKENTELGKSNLWILCPHFRSLLLQAEIMQEWTGLLSHWGEGLPLPPFLLGHAPTGTQKHIALPKGEKQQRKSPVSPPSEICSKTWPCWTTLLTFRYSQGQQDSSVEA